MWNEGMDNELLAFYEQLSRQGAKFYVDNELMLPQKALTKAVEEESIYMADYILGDTGKITEVRFDRINPM
ncbi:MAG: hypothetical protein NC081_01275 [Roseburia sp.]|nr:hypothetical protein [Roseburia sp.]